MLEKVKKHILTSIIIGAVIYLTLSFYADYNTVLEAFENFNLLLIPILLILSYLNYFSRFLKWHYYLHVLNIRIGFVKSFIVFMSGLIMSVTPGKFGELLKSYMLKDLAGEPISKTAPIVLVERITDFLSLLVIAIIGSYVFNVGESIIIGTSIFFVIVVVLLSNKKYAEFFFKIVGRIKFIKRHIGRLEEAYESAYTMLRPRPLVLMFLLSFVAWFFECFGFYLILVDFNTGISLLWSSFTYAFATILGSITMLPGGLGVTDGSLTFFMMNYGIDGNISVASTFIIRVVTLWFAVLVGIISVAVYRKKFGIISFT